jgi:hypothetical protein
LLAELSERYQILFVMAGHPKASTLAARRWRVLELPQGEPQLLLHQLQEAIFFEAWALKCTHFQEFSVLTLVTEFVATLCVGTL